ncbi:MAG: cytochrome c4 [Neisseriaceae bacterium]|nr:cytochrome c4 [Neisseriaceae bacterium]
MGMVVAFGFSSALMAEPSTAQEQKGDASKGKAIVANVCAACHGATGNSVAGTNPSLAGQYDAYLYKQLKAFKSGERKNAIMQGMAMGLSDEDMKNVSAYFSVQTPTPNEATNKALVGLGEQIYRQGIASNGTPACMACHGPQGAGIGPQYPRLGSQQGPYVLTQLKDFKAGVVRKNAIMTDIATRLNDEEMAAVAEYISGLR